MTVERMGADGTRLAPAGALRALVLVLALACGARRDRRGTHLGGHAGRRG